jgi:hypothetical protein
VLRRSAQVTVLALYGAAPHSRNQALFAIAEPFAATGADGTATPPPSTTLVTNMTLSRGASLRTAKA